MIVDLDEKDIKAVGVNRFSDKHKVIYRLLFIVTALFVCSIFIWLVNSDNTIGWQFYFISAFGFSVLFIIWVVASMYKISAGDDFLQEYKDKVSTDRLAKVLNVKVE